MDEYLGAVKQRRDDLFLKLVKKITKPDYKMHFMEDRNGRRAMFYNYKGVEIKENDCVLLKATIAEHRRDRYKNEPLTYLNRVVVRKNMGSKENPKIVFEHPGESTLPTSCFICDLGGMVVICAGTSGYNVTLDLRYHWMQQKGLQGSHLANDEQAEAVNDLIIAKRVDPCLSKTYSFDEIGHAHQLMHDNKHPYGNMACLVNALSKGEGITS